MRPITCIIVDDEPLAVRLLESYVEKTSDLQLLASFTDSITAINAVKAQKPDLLFLDIQMPNIDGMELAHCLPMKKTDGTNQLYHTMRRRSFKSNLSFNPSSLIPSLSASMASGVTYLLTRLPTSVA